MLWMFLACKSPPTLDETTDGPTDPPSETDVPLPTADTAPEVPIVDCTQGPTLGDGGVLTSPRAYHGITFDAAGAMYGSDGNNLLISTGPDDTSLFVPNLGTLQQLATLPTGEIVVARDNTGTIERIGPDGARTVLASGINAYGVTVGPDGFVYTANQSRVHRIDPVNGGAEEYVPTSAIARPKVVTFSADGRTLWVGTISSNGNVWRIDIDEQGAPILPPVFVGRTGGSWHDGITLDACGNLYVNEYNTSTLYLLRHGGDTFEPFIRFNQWSTLFENVYGHGLTWSPDIPPWEGTRVYMPLPYNGNRVGEIDLGLPGRDYNGGVYEVIR